MPKILIIEDEETIRRVLIKVLHQEDKQYEIIEAVDGVDGVSKINSNKFERNKSKFVSKNAFSLENIEYRKYEKVRRENKIIKQVKNPSTVSCDGLCFKIKGTL